MRPGSWYVWHHLMGICLMRRRKFIALAAGAVAWPLAVRAQQAEQMRRIGVLSGLAESDPLSVMQMKSFQEGLRELGWVEGRNIRLDYRWAGADADRYRTYAAELVSLGPDVILTGSTPAARAQQQATRTIPIVFVSISDPVGDGFVASLPTPGSNMTGFSNYDPAMVGKWLELLKEIAPNTRKVAVVYNPDTAPHSIFLPPLKDAMQAFASRWLQRSFEALAKSKAPLLHSDVNQPLACSPYRTATPMLTGLWSVRRLQNIECLPSTPSPCSQRAVALCPTALR